VVGQNASLFIDCQRHAEQGHEDKSGQRCPAIGSHNRQAAGAAQIVGKKHPKQQQTCADHNGGRDENVHPRRVHADDQRDHPRNSQPENEFYRPDRVQRAPGGNGQKLHRCPDCGCDQDAKSQEMYHRQRRAKPASKVYSLVRRDEQPEPHEDVKDCGCTEKSKWNRWRQ
jgi:hypothetical protein